MDDSIPNVLDAPAMTAPGPEDELAKRVRALRARAGWTQQQLADRAGIAQTAVSKLENGTITGSRMGTLRKLATAFAVPVESLTGDAPIPGEPPLGLADEDPIELALFEALNPKRHKPSVFDAARRTIRAAQMHMPRTPPKELAELLLEAATAQAAEGKSMAPVDLLWRALDIRGQGGAKR